MLLAAPLFCTAYTKRGRGVLVLRLLAEAYIDLKSKGEKGAGKLAQLYIDDLVRNHAGTEDAQAARDLQKKLK